ncbi:MAG TPA: bifunctional metallophosphatase/5'-nucleotidase [Vicinamibacterales bacterium]|nr:bifunctional metallophosphatase/5'-nucleotidase [Vicinamibacterales bacterium]
MRRHIFNRALALLLLVCATLGALWDGRAVAQSLPTVTILHINDVYEINAIEGGRYGGLARVATLRQTLERARPPVLMTHGGDYLSPSAIGTAVIDGQPLAGRQMVDVLNAAGLDWAVLGNHEFDVSEAAFRARLAESRFKVVASNVSDVSGRPFAGTVRSAVVPIRSAGRILRIGLIGMTIDANRRPWVRYSPPVDAAREAMAELQGKVDAVIALTHLSLAGDQKLVTEVPGIDVVLGGHEHENWLIRRGPGFTPIVKADANARTVAVVTLTFSQSSSKAGQNVGAPYARPTISTRFQLVDSSVRADRTVQATAQRWTVAAFDAFRKSGFEPERVVTTVTEPLEGLESVVRNRPGRLTDLVTAAFDREAGGVDVALLNGGSIRIDDVIQPGPVTEYDVIRILPFGGKVVRATFEGTLLASVLEIGMKNQGTGGYLHARGIEREGSQWVVKGQPLDPNGRYRVALTDFLLSGGETNLGFLTRTNPGVHDVQDLRDVRLALIDQLRVSY